MFKLMDLLFFLNVLIGIALYSLKSPYKMLNCYSCPCDNGEIRWKLMDSVKRVNRIKYGLDFKNEPSN